MPFYSHDNLQCWFQTCIEEKIESLSRDPDDLHIFALDYINDTLQNKETLKDECEEFIQMAIETKDMGTLLSAIMNSVDWDDLLDDLRDEYKSKIEGEKMWCHICYKRFEEKITNWSFPCRKCDECKKIVS